MSATELPAPTRENTEHVAEGNSHLPIPGFEHLSADRQAFYTAIPESKFHLVRPLLEREIAGGIDTNKERAEGEADKNEAARVERTASPRKAQADAAIDTFHRAERGDSSAKEALVDAKRELLGEEVTDDEVFQTVLESESGNPFAGDVVLEVMLSDEETQAYQAVMDLFKEFQGEHSSVDSVISPQQQIALFCELTKGGGNLADRMFLARQALAVVTDGGARSLFAGFQALGILDRGEVVESGVAELRRLAEEGASGEGKKML